MSPLLPVSFRIVQLYSPSSGYGAPLQSTPAGIERRRLPSGSGAVPTHMYARADITRRIHPPAGLFAGLRNDREMQEVVGT